MRREDPPGILQRITANDFFSSLQGCLPISKEVNRKKESEVEGACWAPVNGDGHHFTKINYLYTF